MKKYEIEWDLRDLYQKRTELFKDLADFAEFLDAGNCQKTLDEVGELDKRIQGLEEVLKTLK